MSNYAELLKLPILFNKAVIFNNLGEASKALGEVKGSLAQIANSSYLIKPLVVREAKLSSKMEGTQSDSQDVYVYDAVGASPKPDTVAVANYKDALLNAENWTRLTRKISPTQIRDLHRRLLVNTPHRGQLGRYRERDVWLAENDTVPIDKADYIPPHFSSVPGHINDLLEYVNTRTDDSLIAAGIFHYMFEAIHPFEDGNGRVGRMLVPAILSHKGAIPSPVIYTSEYFEQDKARYISELRKVDATHDITPWLAYFLEGLSVQSQGTIELVKEIVGLHDDLLARYSSKRAPALSMIIEQLFEHAVFTISQLVRHTGLSRKAIIDNLQILLKDGVIEQLPGVKAPGRGGAAIYFFPALFAITDA